MVLPETPGPTENDLLQSKTEFKPNLLRENKPVMPHRQTHNILPNSQVLFEETRTQPPYQPLTEIQAEEVSIIIGEYKGRIFNYCKRRIGNIQDAEDSTADAFLRLIRRFGDYHPHETLGWRPLLYTTAKRVLINLDRDLRRRNETPLTPLYESQSDSEIGVEFLPSEKEDPETQVIENEKKEVLYEILNSLIPSYKEILLLKLAGQQTNAQIATILNTTKEAVKSRYSRAIRSFRKEMEKSEYFADFFLAEEN